MLWLNKLSVKLGSPDVRARTIRELGAAGDPRALEPLLEVAGDKEGRVRQAVMEALGNLRDPRVFKPLIGGLSDAQDYVRDAAAVSLGKLGSNAVGPLV